MLADEAVSESLRQSRNPFEFLIYHKKLSPTEVRLRHYHQRRNERQQQLFSILKDVCGALVYNQPRPSVGHQHQLRLSIAIQIKDGHAEHSLVESKPLSLSFKASHREPQIGFKLRSKVPNACSHNVENPILIQIRRDNPVRLFEDQIVFCNYRGQIEGEFVLQDKSPYLIPKRSKNSSIRLILAKVANHNEVEFRIFGFRTCSVRY